MKSFNEMTIALASDHAGFALKQQVQLFLEDNGARVKDFGCFNTESCDYPDYARKVAQAVVDGNAQLGLLVCGTGIGMSIAANKVKGIRCGLCTSVEMAEMTRRHNNANILALGGRTTEPELALEIVKTFLDTEFEGGRHKRRTDMLDEM